MRFTIPFNDDEDFFCTISSTSSAITLPIHAIAKLMGHATIQMSVRYAHLSPDFNQSAVDKLTDFKIKGTPKRTPARHKLQNN